MLYLRATHSAITANCVFELSDLSAFLLTNFSVRPLVLWAGVTCVMGRFRMSGLSWLTLNGGKIGSTTPGGGSLPPGDSAVTLPSAPRTEGTGRVAFR